MQLKPPQCPLCHRPFKPRDSLKGNDNQIRYMKYRWKIIITYLFHALGWFLLGCTLHSIFRPL